MLISEIISYTNENIGNGSFFRYGPKPPQGPNALHPCVDKNDPNCPGHNAGLKYQLSNPHDPLSPDEDISHPSFRNGRLQAQNMLKKGWKAIKPTVAKNHDLYSRDQQALQQAQYDNQIAQIKTR